MKRLDSFHNFIQFFNDLMKFLGNLTLILLLIFSVIAGGILSWSTQNMNFFLMAPLIFLIILILIFAIFKIVEQNRNANRFRILGIQNPHYGWRQLDDIPYAGVIWKIRAPKNQPFDIFEHEDIKGIEAETRPRCPVCGTELDESKNIWGKYVWSCVNNDFKKINKENFSTERERVARIARRVWEQKFEQ